MTPRLRLLLLVAVAAGLWIARDRLLPASDVVEADVKGARATQRAPQAKPFDPSTAEVCVTPAALPERGHFAAVGTGDPFTPPKPPAPKPAPVVAVAPPPPPPPPAPPPLRVPYRLMGGLSEKGVPVSVFLALGNAVINAKAGDVLEGGYTLQSISPRELVFVHQQLNQTVRLPVDGDPL